MSIPMTAGLAWFSEPGYRSTGWPALTPPSRALALGPGLRFGFSGRVVPGRPRHAAPRPPARAGRLVPRPSPRPQLPEARGRERFAPRRLIARRIQLRSHAPRRPTRGLPRGHALAHLRGTGHLVPSAHRPPHPMFGHTPE